MGSPGGFGGWGIVLTIDDGRTIEALTRRIETYGHKLTDLSPAWELIGSDILEDNFANFTANGALYAGAVGQRKGTAGYTEWAPLAPSTIRDRMRKGYGQGPTLVRTGELRDSLTKRHAPGNIFEVEKLSLRVGSNHWKALIHHNGTRHIPPRRLVGITWQRRAGIVKRMQDYVDGVIQGH